MSEDSECERKGTKFQPIGGLTKKVLATQSIVESTETGLELTTAPKSTTSLIPLTPTEEHIAIGLVHGRVGVEALYVITPAWHIPIVEPLEARGVRLLLRWRKLGGKASKSDIERATATLAGGTTLVERQVRIAHRVLVTLSQYPLAHKGETIEKAIQDDWIDALEHFPFYAVERACKNWLSNKATCKWRPQIGDIKDLAETYSWQYFKLLRAVE